ncbi:hypothetical protein ACS0TY_002507 [Phlomoides rotata]
MLRAPQPSLVLLSAEGTHNITPHHLRDQILLLVPSISDFGFYKFYVSHPGLLLLTLASAFGLIRKIIEPVVKYFLGDQKDKMLFVG